MLAPPVAVAQEKFVVKPLAEKKLGQLPAGPLYWRIENFATLADAQAAAGLAALAAEADGKAWLFTLGEKGGATAGGHKVAEIGPIPGSRPRAICCASTAQLAAPVPRHRCTAIPVPKAFTS